jgi:hypothetical protein
MAWDKVQRPLELNRLGIHDLKLMGRALRLRWLWFICTDPSRPWSSMPVTDDVATQSFFRVSVAVTVGNGKSTLFWTERWLNVQGIEELAQELLAIIPPIQIRALVDMVVLTDQEDSVAWRWSSFEEFTSKSMYSVMFIGRALEDAGATGVQVLHLACAPKTDVGQATGCTCMAYPTILLVPYARSTPRTLTTFSSGMSSVARPGTSCLANLVGTPLCR